MLSKLKITLWNWMYVHAKFQPARHFQCGRGPKALPSNYGLECCVWCLNTSVWTQLWVGHHEGFHVAPGEHAIPRTFKWHTSFSRYWIIRGIYSIRRRQLLDQQPRSRACLNAFKRSIQIISCSGKRELCTPPPLWSDTRHLFDTWDKIEGQKETFSPGVWISFRPELIFPQVWRLRAHQSSRWPLQLWYRNKHVVLDSRASIRTLLHSFAGFFCKW
jgi:hypothetical protein